jgi:diketogulonate reductase-like aldo/keto reductase
LRRGIELGLTHIDTAEMYGNGAAEEVIAEAIAGLPREQLFIVSKVLPQNAYLPTGPWPRAKASLRRLRTDYLDVYLLHWRGRHPLAETMRASKIWSTPAGFERSASRTSMSPTSTRRVPCLRATPAGV